MAVPQAVRRWLRFMNGHDCVNHDHEWCMHAAGFAAESFPTTAHIDEAWVDGG